MQTVEALDVVAKRLQAWPGEGERPLCEGRIDLDLFSGRSFRFSRQAARDGERASQPSEAD